jgi:hypothetical protein
MRNKVTRWRSGASKSCAASGSTRLSSSQKRAGGWLSLLIRDLVLPFLIPHGIKMERKLCHYRVDLTPLEQP